jgi:putative oxidoreductase
MNWSFLSRWEPRVLSVLRIVSGFLFMQHGLQKILGLLPRPGGQPFAMPPLFSTGGISGWLELVGGALLVLGLFTRPTAFVMSGLMAVAYFYAHAPGGFWPILNRGELAALYCFVFLYLAFAGGGAWSLDNLLRRGKK